MFIGIAGNIGSGKSTLTKMLSHRLGYEAHFEVVQDNPYLVDFYSDMARYSLPIQVFFLSTRFKAHQHIISTGKSSIQDRTIFEDYHVFARNLYETGHMDERDFQTYRKLYELMIPLLNPPNLLVYLRKSVPKLMERIALRGRDYEKSIPEDYISRLNVYYETWIEQYRSAKILVVDSDDLDFIHNPQHFDYLIQKILNAYEQTDLFYNA